MNNNIFINPKLLPFLQNDYRFNVAYGGRASGKSWGIADILLIKTMTEKDKLILCVKGTMRSISDSVKSLIEDSITRNGWDDYYYITDKEIVNKHTKSKFIFYGLQHPERLKSLEGIDYCWIEEATVDVSKNALEILFPTIRNSGSKIFITFNPKHEDDAVYQRFIVNNDPYAKVVKINWDDNPFVSEEIKLLMDYDKSVSYNIYKHVWEGELLVDDENALFKFDDINKLSADEEAEIRLVGLERVFEKIIISLDPSGSAHINSDACGIMVVGKYAGRDRFAIIEDRTKVLKPDSWATLAVQLYHEYNANDIIYESNFGGDMVESVIKSKDRYINPKPVRATKGKLLRAEPIQALYAQGRVDHFSDLGPLELEMTTYTGDPKQKSPNRLDAMVWGISYLHDKNKQANVPMVALSI